MADGAEKPEFKLLAVSGTYDSDGNEVPDTALGAVKGDMPTEEIRFAFAEETGIPPEDVRLPELDGPQEPGASRGQRAGRMSVGFSTWNSSWDPKGGKDGGPVLH